MPGKYSAKAHRHYVCKSLPPNLQSLWADKRAPEEVSNEDSSAVWFSNGKSFTCSKRTMERAYQKGRLTALLIKLIQRSLIIKQSAQAIQDMGLGQAVPPVVPPSPSPPPVIPLHPTPPSQTLVDVARENHLLGARVGGAEYMCLCPWRNEHTAGKQKEGVHDQSTQVGPQSFHCRHNCCRMKGRNAKAFTEHFAKPQSQPTSVILVFDDSGSMTSVRPAIEKQVREVTDKLSKERPDWKVEVWTFGEGHQVRSKCLAKDLFTTSLGLRQSRTDLCQTLFAAATAAMEAKIPTLVYLITDGGATDSHPHQEHAARAVTAAIASGKVTFACVAPLAGMATILQCGIPKACTRDWDGKADDLIAVNKEVVSGISDFAAARDAGATQVNKFFVNGRKLEAILDKLIDVTKLCRVLPVTKECVLQPFVEEHKLVFTPGANFYPLTKKETLRQNRAILVRKRGTQQIYSGLVREALELPKDRDVTVEPGDMGNLELFLESASNNRLLVRGTDLIVKLDVQGTAHTWKKDKS